MTGYEVLFWFYLTNLILLIVHEIDSAYWQEWNLFKLPGEITGFLLMHIPILFLVLYGLVVVFQQVPSGLLFSFFLSASGILAFILHIIFLTKGRKEFKIPVSIILLIMILIVSLSQLILTFHLLLA